MFYIAKCAPDGRPFKHNFMEILDGADSAGFADAIFAFENLWRANLKDISAIAELTIVLGMRLEYWRGRGEKHFVHAYSDLLRELKDWTYKRAGFDDGQLAMYRHLVESKL